VPQYPGRSRWRMRRPSVETPTTWRRSSIRLAVVAPLHRSGFLWDQ
jgi:hypothetical protein